MQAPKVREEVVKGVISSLGFPEDRVEKAISCLMNGRHLDEETSGVDRILSFKEVCLTLSISKSGLRRLVDAHEIRPIRLSKRRIGFRARDVNAFIASRSC